MKPKPRLLCKWELIMWKTVRNRFRDLVTYLVHKGPRGLQIKLNHSLILKRWWSQSPNHFSANGNWSYKRLSKTDFIDLVTYLVVTLWGQTNQTRCRFVRIKILYQPFSLNNFSFTCASEQSWSKLCAFKRKLCKKNVICHPFCTLMKFSLWWLKPISHLKWEHGVGSVTNWAIGHGQKGGYSILILLILVINWRNGL